MGSSIFISSASRSRIARARAWLEARQPAEEILLLGANLDAANELARDVARSKGAAFGWHRLSLSQFAALLAAPELASRGLVSVPPLGVRAICARVVHKLAAVARLDALQISPAGPGFVPALANVTTELRLAKLKPDALQEVAPDLMPLFKAYASMLAEGGFTDWAGLLALATETLAKDSSTRRLTHLPTLLLDVPVLLLICGYDSCRLTCRDCWNIHARIAPNATALANVRPYKFHARLWRPQPDTT
jgi:hypothetical protein